jgi:hypothetical protein
MTIMEHWCKDIDRGKPKYSEKNLSQCYIVHDKIHVGSKPVIRGETKNNQNCIKNSGLTAQ